MQSRLSADVPITYFISRAMYSGPKSLPIATKTAKSPIALFVSNCKRAWVQSGRGRFIRELMRLIDVDSYGSCFHNTALPSELRGEPWWRAKWNVTAHYKFVLAFEVTLSFRLSRLSRNQPKIFNVVLCIRFPEFHR